MGKFFLEKMAMGIPSCHSGWKKSYQVFTDLQFEFLSFWVKSTTTFKNIP
jgi:hypothetical protein